MSICPVCTAPQPEGLACHQCTTQLETALGRVPWIVEQLAITITKQAKIGAGASTSAPARERSPINFGALTIADELADTLGTWAAEIGMRFGERHAALTTQAYLLANIHLVRKLPDVPALIDEIAHAIKRAESTIDRPADRQFLGPCYATTPDDQGRDVTCLADIWAKTAATTATCRTCGITHEVHERRTWLLEQAADRIVTPREAAHLIGNVGHIDVNATRIRNWLNRKQLPMRPGPTEEKHFRLGDLLILLAEKQEKVAA